jgi:hypothetical protein
MADEKKGLSNEELVDLAKKVEDAVEPNIKDEDRVEIKNLADEVAEDIKKSAETTKAEVEAKAEDLAKSLKKDASESIESIKDESQEVKEKAEKALDDTKRDVADIIEEPEIKEELEKSKKELQETKEELKEIKVKGAKNKNRVAQNKIEELKSSVQELEKEVEEAVESVKAKIAEFEDYEASVLNRVIAEAKNRLKDVGFQEPVDEVVLAKAEIKKEDRPISINDVSSGVGGALITGLLGGVATLAGWCIYVAKEQGVPFPPQTLPTLETLQEKATVLATSLGIGDTPEIGAGVAVGSALVVTGIIYKMMVSMRASKNLEIAKKLENDAKEYSQKRLAFKEMVLKIGEHVDELRDTTQNFEVLLDEKSSSLKRVKHFENPSDFDELEDVSKETAQDTHFLVAELERLLASPMAKDGVLNEESIEALNNARELIDKQVDKIYNR